MSLVEKLFGSFSDRELKKVNPIVKQVLALEPKYAALSDAELQAQTPAFKQQLADGKTLDDILPDAFAVCREAAWRVLGMKHFPVQITGGIALHRGDIAEMQTGEGKTLVATLPAYLNALTGEGVHVVTVNDYLAKRDSEWMGKLYRWLGLSVGLIAQGMDGDARRAAYAADITYGTNNEFGFDYLRDNMVTYKANMVQRGHAYAIVKNMIFSSSATVYGDPAEIPITEKCPKGEITNPYGRTKGMLEQILTDLHTGDPEWNIMLLRYFNPIGAHKSGKIGEDPKGIPNNLVPYIAQVAVGKLDRLGVFGDDYNTPDGTGVRDYIHVVDLAIGHVKAIERMKKAKGVHIYNLGTGVGYSVLDVVKAYEKACGKEIPYEIKPRRAGDIATCYCDAAKAKEELGWVAERGIEEMCEDSWRWQSANPDGYRS